MLFFFLRCASQKNLVVSKHISAKCLGEFKEIHISAKCLGEFKEIYNLKKIYKMIVLTLMRKVIYRKVNLGW